MVKPDVVLYEEQLDSDVIEGAVNDIRKADLLIVGGTSLACIRRRDSSTTTGAAVWYSSTRARPPGQGSRPGAPRAIGQILDQIKVKPL